MIKLVASVIRQYTWIQIDKEPCYSVVKGCTAYPEDATKQWQENKNNRRIETEKPFENGQQKQ